MHRGQKTSVENLFTKLYQYIHTYLLNNKSVVWFLPRYIKFLVLDVQFYDT